MVSDEMRQNPSLDILAIQQLRVATATATLANSSATGSPSQNMDGHGLHPDQNNQNQNNHQPHQEDDLVEQVLLEAFRQPLPPQLQPQQNQQMIPSPSVSSPQPPPSHQAQDPESDSLDPAQSQDQSPPPAAEEESRSSSSTSVSSPVRAEIEEADFFNVANDSQSSLGGNMQEMQIDDEHCLAPVNRLPNEILISIFGKLSQSSDHLHCMLTCKRWARNAVEILWHRPTSTTWGKQRSICQTLGLDRPYFEYREFIRRINLSTLAENVNDGSVLPFAVCKRVERMTLANCKGLSDSGLMPLVTGCHHLLAIDISGDHQITDATINALAENCKRLQGLNVSGCFKIGNEGLINLATNCRYFKRLKLNDCAQVTDEAVTAVAEHCPNILEIDLQQCRNIGNDSVTTLLLKVPSLRELRLGNCDLIDNSAFLSLPSNKRYENLRILDLTACIQLTDRAVEKIIDVASRLRNLVLTKCRNLTDAAVYAISRLGKNLHFIHLGHCSLLTDDSVKRLVSCCNRIRYIDFGCCVNLTDDSVTRLATLPKLKRIGLVKCANITDESVYALARANMRYRIRRDSAGHTIEQYTSHSSLERVHLSYCTNLTLKSIFKLLNTCLRLTHLSLTGVPAFLRDDLDDYCRDAPQEFTDHQRSVFCVFSGQGVIGLRRYLNDESHFPEMHNNSNNPPTRPDAPPPVTFGPPNTAPPAANPAPPDEGFDEPDVIEDDDGLDGDEMAIDAPQQQSPANHHPNVGLGLDSTALTHLPPPPPPPPTSPHLNHQSHPNVPPQQQNGGTIPQDPNVPPPPPTTQSHPGQPADTWRTIAFNPSGPSQVNATFPPWIGPILFQQAQHQQASVSVQSSQNPPTAGSSLPRPTKAEGNPGQ